MRGAIQLVTATLLYGVIGIFARTVGLTIPIFYQNITRSLATVIILLVIVTVRHAWKPLAAKDIPVFLIRAVAGVTAFLAYFYTILKVPFGTSYFLFYAGSVLSGYILGHYWYDERLTKIKIVSLGLAIVGLLLIYQINAGTISPFYFALAVFTGVSTAVWDVISKKISGTYDTSYITWWDETLALGMYLVASFVAREQWTMPAVTLPWAASFGIGIVFVATGMLMVNGFKYIEAQIGSIIMLAEILFAIFFAWLFYGETITLMTMLGGSLIVAAIVLPEIYAKSR